jgi:hypothetical protein
MNNGDIIAGGNFTTAGGVTVNYMAEWNGSTWSAFGSGMNGTVFDLDISDEGLLYAGGNFSTANSVTVNHIAEWNGAIFSALQSGVNGDVYSVESEGSLLFVGGVFTAASGLTTADRFAVWSGSTWSHLDIDLPGTPTILAVLIDSGNLYLGFNTAGSANASYLQIITNDGTRSAYPKIVFKRSGGTLVYVEWLKNETTGATLYLDYSLLDGEQLTIDLTEGNRSITSSQFGSVLRASLRSSDFADFFLLPGANNISVLVDESGTPTITAYMQWRNTHWSADGVAP